MRPKNQEQLTALKAFAKAMNVDFDTDSILPNAETLKAMDQAKIGKVKKFKSAKAAIEHLQKLTHV